MNKYTPVIGLEIHTELKTQSKMFCRCSANWFGKEPNSNTCPVCLGLPGALPVPNKKAVEWTILIAKALNCTINKTSKFDRKHYFYPDLPKAYQISQYDEPIGVNGWLEVKNLKMDKPKKFHITRVHLEEDTGKLMHEGAETLVDFNRSSVPLVEIVTEPDFDNSDDVKVFLEELRTIIRYLDVSDADMEKGSMRLEPNISIRLNGQKELPNYKVEVKNINSFQFVKNAIDFEVLRHIQIIEKGETPIQETRGYVEATKSTVSQRTKEEAHDYRYFPEPDIPPMVFSGEFLNSITVPELPVDKMNRYIKDFGLKFEDAFILTREKQTADYFESILSKLPSQSDAIKIANFIINKKIATDISVKDFVLKAEELLSPKKTDEHGLQKAITNVIRANTRAVDEYKNGKESVIMFLVGMVMREMKGSADATLVKKTLEEKLRN